MTKFIVNSYRTTTGIANICHFRESVEFKNVPEFGTLEYPNSRTIFQNPVGGQGNKIGWNLTGLTDLVKGY